MRLKPNDAPCMELDEKRNFRFNLSGAVGVNNFDGTPVVSSARGLTVGTVSPTGTALTVPITATQTGCHVLKVTAPLSSGEIIVGVLRVKVIDSTHTEARGYG